MKFPILTNLMFLIGSFLVTTMLMSTGCQAEEGKDVFLNRHNHLRGQVKPAAANMKTMVWDEDLKNLAKAWAKKCIAGHPGQDQKNWTGLGQNIFISMAKTKFNAATAVDSWDSEKKNYDYVKNSCADGKTCGHYTQVVWAESEKLGCSFHKCTNMTGIKNPQMIPPFWNVVCQYKPPGNVNKRRPYLWAKAVSHDPRAVFIFIVAAVTLLYSHTF